MVAISSGYVVDRALRRSMAQFRRGLAAFCLASRDGARDPPKEKPRRNFRSAAARKISLGRNLCVVLGVLGDKPGGHLHYHGVSWAAPATRAGGAVRLRAHPIDLARRETTDRHSGRGRQVLVFPGPIRALRGLYRVVHRVHHAIEPQVQLSADAGKAKAEIFRRG